MIDTGHEERQVKIQGKRYVSGLISSEYYRKAKEAPLTCNKGILSLRRVYSAVEILSNTGLDAELTHISPFSN